MNNNYYTEDEINALLDQHWPEISERSARRVARIAIWDSRLALANRYLVAALVLMMTNAVVFSCLIVLKLHMLRPAVDELLKVASS